MLKTFLGRLLAAFTALAVLAAAVGCSNRLPSSLDAGASLASATGGDSSVASASAASDAGETSGSEEASGTSSSQPASEEAPSSSVPSSSVPSSSAPSSSAFVTTATPPTVPGGEYQANTEGRIIELINDLRQSLGLQPLVYDANLQVAARIRAGEMALAGDISHTRPDGRECFTVLDDVGLVYTGAGENLAWRRSSTVSAQDLFTQWENSPSHYDNMVHPLLTHVGLGVVIISEGPVYQAYACTTFAVY